MSKFEKRVVLITGGGSGIGKIMARLSLERGAKVAIWDLNQASIDATVEEFSALGTIKGYKVDVSDPEDTHRAAQALRADLNEVDIIINNAGIVIGKSFEKHTTDDIRRVMDINANGPMYVAHEFIADMTRRNSGHICNIASSAGYVADPNMSIYGASKWAVVGWSDSLRVELKKLRSEVRVTTIMPYYINTGMFDGVKSRIPILKPESAALTIIKSIERNTKLRSIARWLYPSTRLMQAILPLSLYDYILDKVFGIYNAMDNFTGRKK